MGRPHKKRRQGRGSAWHWKQTDCWYYTLPGTKKRIPLFDDEGQRIRGNENQQAAERAFTQAKLANADRADGRDPANEVTRKIPVHSTVVALTRRLLVTLPKVPASRCFAITQGNAWKRMTGVVRFLAPVVLLSSPIPRPIGTF